MVFGFFIYVANAIRAIIADGGPRETFETIDSMLTFYPGLFTILVASLIATRDRRADSREMLAPSPGRLEERTRALILASLAPAAVGLMLVVALHGYFVFDDRYVLTPSVWHILQGPVALVGGCLFGIMLANWVPMRGAAVVGVVVLVALTLWLSSLEGWRVLGPLMTWPIWGVLPEVWAGTYPGSPAWHVVYLVGLCGMAAAAALLRVVERRTPVIVGGAVAVGIAVLGGIGQLP
jgi:hypothetical protein